MQDPNYKRSSRSKMPPRGWKGTHRVSSYKAPPQSRFRRILGLFFNRWTFSLACLVLLVGFLTTTYFWFEFSDRIDQKLLSGSIFTPTAGIYSAPKTLRSNEPIDQQGLINYLKTAGYIEKNAQADQSRSRYSLQEGKLLIEPGATAISDGEKTFPTVLVTFAKDNKKIEKITDLELNEDQESVKLEPRMLSTIAAEGDGRRKSVNFADLPPNLVKAIIVTEDRAFFDHHGVNLRGIARALWSRYEGEENSTLANQGGSSITQQLVKNLLLTRDPTWERKATEAFMSVILETRLSKEEIFTLYANQIYLGQQIGVSIYGVGEAADAYFGKDVSQLTLPEAAFLAGIIRSPNRYNPYKNTERVEERRNQVLQSMLEAGEITEQQYAAARNIKLELKQISSRNDLQGMPYFSQHVIDELPKLITDPEALQHLRVYTSIDPDLQRIAYEIVAKRLDKLEKLFKKQEPGNLNAALVAIKPKTGEIVAMVGGRDYLQNQFNRATSAMRQPGSVFKPFVYAAAINSVYEPATRLFTAATVMKDEKKIFTSGRDSYAPNNYGDHFSNKDITVRDALVRSKNTVTVDIGMQVNIGRVMNMAHKAGMPKVEKAYPSMALGTAEATPLQVAAAYTMFANLGDAVAPMPITRVASGDGATRLASNPEKKTIVRPDVAYIMNDIMKDVINRGTAAQVQGWGLRNNSGKVAIAGKTGTSRDGWFAGFTPELVTVVYVGFDNNDDLNMKGSDSAMPIWADFMKEALDLHPEWNGDWTLPAGVRKAEIDIRDGTLIRELDSSFGTSPSPSPTVKVSPTPFDEDDPLNDPAWAVEGMPEMRVIEDVNVPPEFRRVELFIGGTIPMRKMMEEMPLDPDALPGGAAPTPTPLSGTWQENIETPSGQSNQQPDSPPRNNRNDRVVNVTVCPLTGMRATSRCPSRESRSFKAGAEPNDFCAIHQK